MYRRNTRDLGATGVWKRLDKSQLFHPAPDFYSKSYRHVYDIECAMHSRGTRKTPGITNIINFHPKTLLFIETS